MSTFAEQVAAALDTTDAQEAGHRVHRVVADEMRSLDPTAKTRSPATSTTRTCPIW